MKKLLLAVLLVLALTLTIVSCGGDKQDPAESGTDTSAVTKAETDTEKATEKVTEKDTEEATETVPETDPETVPETDPETVPETEPETDPETETETEPETEPEMTPVYDEAFQPEGVTYGKVTFSMPASVAGSLTKDAWDGGIDHNTDLILVSFIKDDTIYKDMTIREVKELLGEDSIKRTCYTYDDPTDGTVRLNLVFHFDNHDALAPAQIFSVTVKSGFVWCVGSPSGISGELSDVALDKDVTFTFKSTPAVLTPDEAGLIKDNHDAENADNYAASIAGWMGFSSVIDAVGCSVDGSAIVWMPESSINRSPEGPVKELAGENAVRYSIKADLTKAGFGEHTIVFYVKLESGDYCEIYTTTATTEDDSIVGDASYNFDSSVNADLSSIFTFKQGLSPQDCHYVAADFDGGYKMAGINQLTTKADGTFALTLKDFKTTNGHAALLLRGNPNPDFGDANYYGHDGNNDTANPDSLSFGCAGIYVGIETVDDVAYLRLNVKGEVDGKAIPHVFKVAMSSYDLKVTDDGSTITFYEGETVLATVVLSGNDAGYATQAVVTANGETVTLDDVCAAASVASDIGLIARSSEMTFSALTLTGLGA